MRDGCASVGFAACKEIVFYNEGVRDVSHESMKFALPPSAVVSLHQIDDVILAKAQLPIRLALIVKFGLKESNIIFLENRFL